LPLGRFAAPSKKVQIDVRLDEVVLRALEKEPEARYQQVSQLKTQVDSVTSTPADSRSTAVPPGVDPRDFAHWEKRAPGWHIRCRKCGFTEQWGKFGIRKYASGISYKFGRCPNCHRFGWAVVERSDAPPPVAQTQATKPESQHRLVRGVLWVFAILLFLNFALPHRLDFSQFGTHMKTIGGTQPWLSWVSKVRDDSSVERTVDFNRRSTAFYSGILGAILAFTLVATRKGGFLNPSTPTPLPQHRSWALRIPLVMARDNQVITNWPIVLVTGALMAVLMTGGFCAAAGFSLSEKSVGWVLKFMVLPAVVLIPLWLHLLIREQSHAMQPSQESPKPCHRYTGLRRLIGAIIMAFILAACVRVVIEPFRAMNDAVAPEINPGSTVFIYKLGRKFRPGDVVVYRWFATGYPDKYLLGRVVELPHDGQVAIERKNQEPQLIAIGDVVGQVIFNTR
jgi:hypothetical protein